MKIQKAAICKMQNNKCGCLRIIEMADFYLAIDNLNFLKDGRFPASFSFILVFSKLQLVDKLFLYVAEGNQTALSLHH